MSDETQQEVKGLTPEQVGLFHEQGFLKIGKLLDDDLVEVLCTEYDALFAEAQHSGRYRNLAIDDTESVEEKKQAPEQMLQIMQMCERSIPYRKLLYHEPILDMIESLLGPNLQLFHDQALYKPAHQGGAVFWHQDNAYWKCTPANLVSCWMTLDEVDVSNGAMHLIPGSHRHAVSHDRSSSTSALLDLGDKIDEKDAVVINLPAGGALIHHCQTLHYTPPNTTDRQRRAFIIHFMTPGTRNTHEGNYIGVSFTHPMLRMRV
jgi:ectoine hydroxylase-related dioxygenase (phytanoyl-CoA dioxygenase family)